MKRLVLLIMLSLAVLTGCMTTRNGNKADNIFPPGDGFNKKKVAILPVKSQTSLTTDSHTPLKKALNKKILEAVKFKMTNAVLIDSQKSLDVLNDAGKLDLIEKLLAGYESAGAFDKKLIASLCSVLKVDYLLLTKLKVEQFDMSFIAKSFTGSLEVILLDKRTSEPLWSGIGDFKRMGTYGTGGTETDEAASELVSLAFGQSISNSQQNNKAAINKSTYEDTHVTTQEPITEPAAQPVEQPVAQPVEKKSESRVEPQRTTSSSASMIVINSKAKLRKNPSAKATVIKTLKKGEEVQVVKLKDEWCLIELAGGETGWCLKGSLAQMN